MPVLVEEKSAGAVVFRRNKDQPEYLILHYPAGHWDFPKGNIERSESEDQTAKREVFEETGIKDLIVLEGFKRRIQYQYRRNESLVKKQVVFYAAETSSKDVKLSKEHLGFSWAEYDRAREIVTFDNAKRVLAAAHSFIQTRKSATKKLDEYPLQETRRNMSTVPRENP